MTFKQDAFAREYLVDGNGKAAAIRAGYAPKRAKEQASQLLHLPTLQAKIEEYRRKVAQRSEVTREDAALRQEEISAAAQKAGQFGPSAQAAMNAARIRGQVVERRADVTSEAQRELAEQFGPTLSPKQVEILEALENEEKVH